MMKMMMRLGPTQIQETYRWDEQGEVSQAFVKPVLAMMAGYRSYKCLMIAAAGGAGGRAQTATNSHNPRVYLQGNGSGGGGSLELHGYLADLPASALVFVGAQGTSGANGGDEALAGDGTQGGSSTFNGHAAYGGYGGEGSRWDTLPMATSGQYNSKEVIHVGYGGDGGGNSEGLGTPGQGGVCSRNAEYPTPLGGLGNNSAGTAGTYEAGGSYPVIGGGCGGGGGGGRCNNDEAYEYDAPKIGGAGSTGASYSGISGGPAYTNQGGGGGGGFITDYFPDDEVQYGCRGNGTTTDGNGVVVLQLLQEIPA